MVSAPSRIVRHDLMCTDPPAGARFYAELFGWTLTELKVMGMTITRMSLGDHVLGAVMPFDRNMGFPSHWMPYMQTESVDETCRRVSELGGAVCMGAMDIPPGRFALTNDPAGAVFSPFTPRQVPADAAQPAAPGMFCWDELLTTDVETAVAFYTGLLGWSSERQSMAEGEYTVFTRNGVPAAGAMAMPAGATFRPSWRAYVATRDVDATAANAVRLGATITTAPADIPGIGRFAVLVDPTGARFGLLSTTG